MHSAGQIGDLAVTKDPAAWRGVIEAALLKRYNHLGPTCADSWSIPLVKRKILSPVKMAASLGSSIYYLLPPSSTLKRDKWSQSHAWWRVCAKSLQSCLTLCNPTDCSQPGSSVHGTLQAGILEWAAIFSSRGSSRSGSNGSPRCRQILYCLVRREMVKC